MAHDAAGRDTIIVHQGFEQIVERTKLAGGGLLLVEVPDESDSYALIVHSARFAVSAALLFDPAGRRFDLAVTLPQRAVVDKEMVPEAVPETTILVGPVDQRCIPDIGGRMVDDDVFPLGIRVEGDDVFHDSRVGDCELLSLRDRLPGSQAVGGVNGFLGNVVHPGNAPDCLHRADFMGDRAGSSQIGKRLFDDCSGTWGGGRDGWSRRSRGAARGVRRGRGFLIDLLTAGGQQHRQQCNNNQSLQEGYPNVCQLLAHMGSVG